MFNQIFGTVMGTKCVTPYACLTIGYEEETELCTQDLPKYFFSEECLLIEDFFKRYVDDAFIFSPKYLDFNSFSICLNNLHPAIKCTFEKAKVIVQNLESCQVINFYMYQLYYILTELLKQTILYIYEMSKLQSDNINIEQNEIIN